MCPTLPNRTQLIIIVYSNLSCTRRDPFFFFVFHWPAESATMRSRRLKEDLSAPKRSSQAFAVCYFLIRMRMKDCQCWAAISAVRYSAEAVACAFCYGWQSVGRAALLRVITPSWCDFTSRWLTKRARRHPMPRLKSFSARKTGRYPPRPMPRGRRRSQSISRGCIR